jgi:hypothetical protein
MHNGPEFTNRIRQGFLAFKQKDYCAVMQLCGNCWLALL